MASVLRGCFVTLTSRPFLFSPQERRVGETLERKPWVVRNRSKKKKSVWGWGWGRGRGRDPCPSGGASSSGDADAEKESRKALSTLELLPGSELQCSGCFHRSSQSYHPRMRVPGIVQDAAFLEEAPCCLQRSERGGGWTSQDDP